MTNTLSTDTLPGTNYKILQSKDYFCYGIDAVLLSDFAGRFLSDGISIADLCSGNGAVAMMLSHDKKNARIKAVEIQKDVAFLAQKSIELNDIQNVKVVEGDIRKLEGLLKPNDFDAVTVNPPYMKAGCGRRCKNTCKAIAREEILCTLKDVIKSADYLLKENGYLFMIHRPERLEEIRALLGKYDFLTERITMVIPKEGEKATMVLFQAKKSSDLTSQQSKCSEDVLCIYGDDGKYTDEVKKIYSSE